MQQMPPGNTQLPFYTPFYPLAISILSFLLSLFGLCLCISAEYA